MGDRVLFITGATGLVGGELVRRYMAQGVRVYALVRAPSPSAAEARLAARLGAPVPPWVTAVPGDLTADRLGLDDATWNRVALDVTDVLHAATDINFGRPLEQARAVNVVGTQRVVELARTAPRLRQIAHVSTVHVAGRRTGRILERELRHTAGWLNTYEQTKYEAECWLHDQMSELPVAVYRMSSVLGDARTGEVRQFNFLHQLLRLLWGGLLPALPGDPNGVVDLIPSDWLGDALTALFDARFKPGTTLHLCAGAAKSYTLLEVLTATLAKFERFAPGRPVPSLPMLLSLDEFEAFVGDAEARGQGRLAQALGALRQFAPHLSLPKVFDNRQAQAALAETSVRLPDIREYHDRVIEYCLRSHWGRRPTTETVKLQEEGHA